MAAANFLWLHFAESIEARFNLFFDISGSWFSHDVIATILLSRLNPLKRDFLRKHVLIRKVSNDCRKTYTKEITPTNHNRRKQHDEPIRIPSNYL